MNKSLRALYRQAITLLEEYQKSEKLVREQILVSELNSVSNSWRKALINISTYWYQLPGVYDGSWNTYIKVMWDYSNLYSDLYYKKCNLLEQWIKLELEALSIKIQSIDEFYSSYIENEKSHHDFWFIYSKDKNIWLVDENWKEIITTKDFTPKYTKEEVFMILSEQYEILKSREQSKWQDSVYRLTELVKKIPFYILTLWLHPIYSDSYDIRLYLKSFRDFEKDFYLDCPKNKNLWEDRESYREKFEEQRKWRKDIKDSSGFLSLWEFRIESIEGLKRQLEQTKSNLSSSEVSQSSREYFQEESKYFERVVSEYIQSEKDWILIEWKFFHFIDSDRSMWISKELNYKSLVSFCLYQVKERYNLSEELYKTLNKSFITVDVTFSQET